MLSLDHVDKKFNAFHAVKDISLTIEPGMMVGVIGRSGAGKSTLLRMINRLGSPTSGRILFDGVDVTALKGAALRAWQADCAMIFQQFNLVPRLDVLTNVMLGRLNKRSAWLSVAKIFTDEERAMALHALERLGIADIAMKRAGNLSGGQQQRVAIARALLQQPKVILADEPIASLDPRNAKIVMGSLATINAQENMTVLVNLHTLDTARAYCSRIIGMAAGEVVFDGTPDMLTMDVARSLYGADGVKEAFSEAMTSTSLDPLSAPIPANVQMA